MKFLVDAPSGGLAKWLRFCGFDAALSPFSAAPSGNLPAPATDTYILTLQQSLAKLHREDILVLTAATPEAQLAEILQRLQVSSQDLDPMSRCVKCNEPLAPAARDAVAGRVPEYVFHTQKEFSECPACHRLYWPGSHITGINHKVFQALSAKSRRPKKKSSRHQRSSP